MRWPPAPVRRLAIALALLAALVAPGAATLWIWSPDASDIQARVIRLASSNGLTLLGENEVPPVLAHAVVATENERFYSHHGVDSIGLGRALLYDVVNVCLCQGGSTITQQLVKNTLSTNRKRDLKTKAREAILAIRPEHEISKDRILEDYLNLVYFGNRAYGVSTAAERYFSTPKDSDPLRKITLPQAALLAGLIQSPEALTEIDAANQGLQSELLQIRWRDRTTEAAISCCLTSA